MYARVLNIALNPNKVEAFIQVYNEAIIPFAQQQKGFKGMTLLVDPQTHNAISISYWENQADIIANEESGYYRKQLAKIAPYSFGFPVDQHYEVRVQT